MNSLTKYASDYHDTLQLIGWDDDSIFSAMNGFEHGAKAERDRARLLVDALEKMYKEAKGLIYAHEFALSMDGGNSNMQCVRIAIANAECAISEYHGEQKQNSEPSC